jgi:hypothetical protein
VKWRQASGDARHPLGNQELVMRAWLHLLKARFLLLCSAGVVLIGLALFAYLLGLVAWQVDMHFKTGSWIALPAGLAFVDRALLQSGNLAPVLAFIPQLDSTWSTHDVVWRILSQLHIGAIPGLIGFGVMAVGISSLLRQKTLIRIHKERRKATVHRLDPAREASRAKAGDDGRQEPFIGAADSAANTDRRAA